MLQLVTVEKFLVVLLKHSNSTHRFKSLFLTSSDLRDFPFIARQLAQAATRMKIVDGVKLLFSSETPALQVLTETKYWFQDQVVSAPITCVLRFDGLTGRWSIQERVLWLDFIAKLETNSSVLFCSGMANVSNQWEPVAKITETGLTIHKPLDSKIKFDI